MATASKFANANTVVTTGWSGATDAYSDNGVYATAAPGKNADITTDFGFPAFTTSDIPAGSTINSVTVEAQYKSSTTGSTNATFGLQLNNGGTLLGSQTTFGMNTADQTVTKQETAGIALADLQTANVVTARVEGHRGSSNTAITWSLDYVKVTVDYTVPVAVTGTGSMVAGGPGVAASATEELSGSGSLAVGGTALAATAVEEMGGTGAISAAGMVLGASGTSGDPVCALANSYEVHDVGSATVTVTNVVVGAGQSLVALALYNPTSTATITGLTWNTSEAFTLVSGLARAAILAAPSAGTHSVVLSLSASPSGRVALFVGVLDHYGSVRNVATGATTTLTQTLTTVAGDLCLAWLTSSFGDTNDLDPDTGTTSLLKAANNVGGGSASVDVYAADKVATGTSTNLGWVVVTQDANRSRKSEYLALQAPGTGGVTGTGAITAGGTAVAGSGTEGVSGTGAIVAPASVAANGTESISGSGSMTAPAALAAAGAEQLTGTGSVTAHGATVSGSGAEAISGTGAVRAPAAVAASGTEQITGTGAVAAPAAVSGSGTNTPQGVAGNGSVTVGGPSVSGTGAERLTGTGSVTPAGPGVAGAGSVGASGSSAIVAAGMSLAGGGTVTAPSSSTGAITVAGLSIAGAGSVTAPNVGTGGITAPGTSTTGSGAVLIPGTGSVSVGHALTGVGTTGSGLLITGVGSITTAGARVRPIRTVWGTVTITPRLGGSLCVEPRLVGRVEIRAA